MSNPFQGWIDEVENRVETVVRSSTESFANETRNAVAEVTGAAVDLGTQLTAVATALGGFTNRLQAIGLPSPADAASRAARQISDAIAALGQPPKPPDPQRAAQEVIDWARTAAAALGKSVTDFFQQILNTCWFWVRVDGELIAPPTADAIVNPEQVYRALIAKIESAQRPLGHSFSVEIGGMAVAPLAVAIAAAQGGGRSAVVDAMRQFMFALPGISALGLSGTRILRPNPTYAVLIVSMLCLTCVAIALGIPAVAGGSAVFFGVAAAIVIAAANGDEIDVQATNEVEVALADVNGMPLPKIKVGPQLTLRIRRAR